MPEMMEFLQEFHADTLRIMGDGGYKCRKDALLEQWKLILSEDPGLKNRRQSAITSNARKMAAFVDRKYRRNANLLK